VNLAPVDPADLELLAFGNYGHYTSMQVRNGSVRGLDLHLDRLNANAEQLFGRRAAEGRVLEALHHCVPASDPCSVRVTLFSRDLRKVLAGEGVEPDIMVSVTSPATVEPTPIRVLPVRYEREMPQVKHLATYGLLRHMRTAAAAGFDDALFVDSHGNVSEGTTWNVCFTDGAQWWWPEASVLDGVTMQLLRSAMQAAGWPVTAARVSADHLTQVSAAFSTNSVLAARPISAIGEWCIPDSVPQTRILQDLYESIPWQSL
jgi:branched-subunit amino acid aminotransferase/4-amino-4-deoxychorismate lyase